MRNEIGGGGGEANISYKGMETSSEHMFFKTMNMFFKTMRLTAMHNKLKWTISTGSGLALLHMVSKLDTGRWVDCEIPHRMETRMKNIFYKGVKASP